MNKKIENKPEAKYFTKTLSNIKKGAFRPLNNFTRNSVEVYNLYKIL